MSKILNLSNDIKINKNNLQTTYTTLTKSSGGESNSVTFTLNSSNDSTPILLANFDGSTGLVLCNIRGGNINGINVVGSNITANYTAKTLTVNSLYPYALATIIDFSGNTWS